MERVFGVSREKNADVFSDPSHRMPKRPLAIKSGEGVGFQDFGSSFGPPKPTSNHKNSPKSKLKPSTTLTTQTRKAPPAIQEDESDDELLLSSQGSESAHATSSMKRVAKGRKPSVLSSDEETVQVGDRVLAAHPDFKPSSYNVIKRLRFTKSRKPALTGDDIIDIPPSSSLPDSQDLFKPISDDIEVVSDLLERNIPSPQQNSPEMSATRHGGSDATPRRSPDTKKSSTSKPSPPTTCDVSRKSRPRPRPVMKPVRPGRDSNESTPRQTRDVPPRSKAPAEHIDADRNTTTKELPPSRRAPQAFPMVLDAKETTPGDNVSPTRTKKSVTSLGPRQIPLPSPLKTKLASRESTFPTLSPLSSSIDKGKARAMISDEDDANLSEGLEKRSRAKPFPMSSQMLAAIDRRSRSPSNCSHGSTKRASSDDSGNEQGRTVKKRKDSRSGTLNTFDYMYEPMEDDSFDLGRVRDPSKICPYCDEDLPSHPTPLFQNLLATARKKSVSDPRPRNRGGLKAPLTIYVSVCQRHRFESHQLPIATAKGWPKKIDFTKVPVRVKKMKKELEAIVLDKDDFSDIEGFDNSGSRGPRSRSIFWREMKKQIKKQGVRNVVGVRGQFASFEKAQAGYYGEQGSVIIHQTLFDLFPPSTFDGSLIAPLAPAEFIQRILMPEAAVRLIAQDLGADIQEAAVTLRESAQYGVAMFPDTNEHRHKGATADDDEMGVADRIVMERARARRKELAEQEKAEEEMLEKERAAHRARARESRREKALLRAQQAREDKVHAGAAGDVSDVSKGAARGTRRTGQRVITDNSESDAMSVDSSTSRRSTRALKKGGQSGNKAKPQRNSSDSDSMEIVSDRGCKARSAKNNTKERVPDPEPRTSKQTTVAHELKKPFTRFTALDNDGEHEITPRPVKTHATTPETAVGGGRILPLQIARNRQTSKHSDWSHSLRTDVLDDTDSDSSRGSQRLVRAPIRKGAPQNAWLFSSSPSGSD